jgi:hypothetical protein
MPDSRIVELVLDQFNLRAMALKLNPDDPSQCLPGNMPGELSFYEDFQQGRGKVIATVILAGSAARVIVERAERLIRRNHRVGFRPDEVGIYPRRGGMDLDLVLDLTEVVEIDGEAMRTARQRVLSPQSRPYRPPQVIRAFRGRE